jgi:outer membrane protein
LTLGRLCSYNEIYSTLKIEWYGVVFTHGIQRETLGVSLPSPFDRTAWLASGRDPAWSVKKIKITRGEVPETISKEFSNLMTRKFARFLLATIFVLSVTVLAQTAGADPALPAAPSAAATTPDTTAASTSNRIGTINIEQAIFASNEGQRDFDALSKKLEPKQTELKNMNDEVESLKKQLNDQGSKLNEDSRGALVKQIEEKQKKLERSVQDARDDAQSQQNEIAQRILQKMAPIIVKYAGDKGFGLIMDTSNPWPQGPVLWAGPSVDITKAIVDAYNSQSGVPAPTRPAAKPAATGAKPAAPSGGTKPATTTTPAPK